MNAKQRILIYGAGVIGSIFAGMIAKAGFDVTVLARGKRYAELNQNELILVNSLSNQRLQINVKIINQLAENDIYDYIIVVVQNTQIDSILPVLTKNQSKNIVFVVNNSLGYQKWIDAVGYERIMIGFPSAGGERKDAMVNYFIGKGPSRLFQSTTFGELSGKNTERLIQLVKIFKQSGFSPSKNNQKKHGNCLIMPIVNSSAIFRISFSPSS